MEGSNNHEPGIPFLSQKSVFVFGASARALAQSAARAGLKVVTADLFADRDTQKTAQRAIKIEDYPEGFASAMGVDRFDFSAFTGGIENQPGLISRIERKMKLLGNPAATLQRLLDVKELFLWLRKRGFTVPPFYSPDELPRHLWQTNRGILAKQPRTSGGIGVEFARLSGQPAKLHDRTGYYQQFIPGENISAAFVAGRVDGRIQARLIGVSRQLQGLPGLNAPGFSYCGSVFPFHLSRDEQEYVQRLGKAIAAQYELIGLFNIDLIRTDSELYFLEVNPRYSASMELMERQFRVNLFEIHYLACTAGDDNPGGWCQPVDLPKEYPFLGKAIWYADRELCSDADFCEFVDRQMMESGFLRISDIPRPGATIKKGAPVFTVFAHSRCEAEIDEKLVETARMFGSRLCS